MQKKKGMDREEKTKIATLIIASVLIAIQLFDVNLYNVGIACNSPWWTRLTYHFFHASFLHVVLNAWWLIALVFIYDISYKSLMAAFTLACMIPNCCLSDVPTVGASGLIFVLFGAISFMVKQKTYYQACMATTMLLGFLIPQSNAWIHVFCYAEGLMMGVINKPINIKRNGWGDFKD